MYSKHCECDSSKDDARAREPGMLPPKKDIDIVDSYAPGLESEHAQSALMWLPGQQAHGLEDVR